MKRRELIKKWSVLPLAGAFFPLNASDSFMGSPEEKETGPLVIGPNIYESIGVEPIINCRGTFTIIGGSLELPEVVVAMKAASGHFVQYDELAFGVGKRLAEITGAEWGMVSAGCAAGLKHVTAACVTGGNPEKLIRIPDLTGFEKNEVIMPASSRNAYDHAVRNIGAKIITIHTPEELSKAINPKTALIYMMADETIPSKDPLSLEVVAQIAKAKNIPILVDAAAEILTIPNIHLQRGATVVAYSGGKAICGPQCAGLLLGKKDLLMSAWQASAPHHGPGRDNKVGKEEMMGMLAAVEAWTKRDHAGEWKTWISYLNTISNQVTKIDGVKTSIFEPTELSNKSPVLTISWDPNKLYITGEEVAEIFARSKPRIAVGGGSNGSMTNIKITTGQMQPGNDKIVAERIFNLLSQKRVPKSNAMMAPSANIKGQWDLTVEFFNSTSLHKLYLEQDGNWIQGTHASDFTAQEIMGMVEGDQIKLRSNLRTPGDQINYMFSGTIADNMMSGSIFLGEYLNAKFTAKRSAFKMERKKIVIPGGPPLAT